jgi:hypothetical protein
LTFPVIDFLIRLNPFDPFSHPAMFKPRIWQNGKTDLNGFFMRFNAAFTG